MLCNFIALEEEKIYEIPTRRINRIVYNFYVLFVNKIFPLSVQCYVSLIDVVSVFLRSWQWFRGTCNSVRADEYNK